jgi:RNA polymerase sigma-70 factor
VKTEAAGLAARREVEASLLPVVMADLTLEVFSAQSGAGLEELYESSGARRWAVSRESFAQACWRGVSASGGAEHAVIAARLGSLRSEDLALALGCLNGNERAWDTFYAQFRPTLYNAARALTHDEAQARDLADSLLAELFGAEPGAEGRRPRLAYFHGRSSLKTWLRSVLYQKFVDEYRRQSRLEPLAEESADPAVESTAVSEPDERRYADCLSEALECALAELKAPDKLLLSYYYVQGLTLKQIGRLAAEHEATISRHLERLRGKLRKRIEGYLRKVRKLSAYDVDRCLDFAARGVSVELEKILKPQ